MVQGLYMVAFRGLIDENTTEEKKKNGKERKRKEMEGMKDTKAWFDKFRKKSSLRLV
jgi:hypothetical protein